MNPRISIITLGVDDLQRSLAFYRDGLRLPTPGVLESADHVAFELQAGLTLVLYPRTEIARVVGDAGNTRSSTGLILSHAAAGREEVDMILASAGAAGATLLGPTQDEPWGYSGYFKDPDGHVWEIIWNPGFELGE